MNPITFGLAISQLADKLGGLIDKATNGGEIIALSAGNQVALAIEWAKQSYADSLDLTMDRITAEQKKVIDDLATEIHAIETDALVKMQQIADQGSIALNTLPVSNHFPQLGHYGPAYVAKGGNVLIEVSGNFFDAARQGYAPTLTVGDLSIPAETLGTLKLSFRVPSMAFAHVAGKLSNVEMTLDVPYLSHVLVIFPKKESAVFKLRIASLPPTAGTIKFYTDRSEQQTFTQSNHGPEHIQESDDDDIPDPIGSGKVWTDSPTPGWFVNPVSVQANWTHTEGDWHDFGNRSNAAGAAWSVATVHHGVGSSGKVHFNLSWTEQQTRTVDIPAEQDTELEWGSSRGFTVPDGGTWRATYVDFTGKSFDINGPAFDNPYIRIVTSGNSVNAVTVP